MRKIIPFILNIELTTKCLLNCSQCYKSVQEQLTKELPIYLVKELLFQAKELGTKIILLSGGEPLLYKGIFDIVKLIKELNMDVYISTSGKIDSNNKIEEYFLKLKENSLDILYISLNGSTEEINNLSRDGYIYAINAIKIANKLKLRTRINWVARQDNIEDLPNLFELAKKYNVEGIDILKNKKNKNDKIEGELDKKNLLKLKKIINKPENEKFVIVESCFFELRNLLGLSYTNSILKGCSAGRYSMSVDCKGNYMPCIHITKYKENYSTLKQYWFNSEYIKLFRQDRHALIDCKDCQYSKVCIGCMNENNKIKCCLKEE